MTQRSTEIGELGGWDPAGTTGAHAHWIQVIESSSVGYAYVDLDRKVRAANSAWCAMFGQRKATVIGRSVWELIHPDEVARVKEMSDNAVAQKKMMTWRARHLREDGSTFWGQVTVTPTFDADGTVIGISGSILDVTKDAAAIDALAESERKFRMIASNSSDLVLWVRDSRVSWASPACAQFGWSPDELVGRRALELVHIDDQYLSEAAKKSRDLTSEDVRLRFRFVTADGGSRWVEAHASPYRDENGNVDGTVSVIRDVSGQVAAEHALRASEREFRLLAENAADVVIRFDDQCVRRWVSGSVRDLLGWDPDAFLAAPLSDLIHPDDLITTTPDDDDPADFLDTAQEFRVKHGDGRWVWVSKKTRSLIDGSHIEALRCIDDEVAARDAAAAAMTDLAYRSSHDLLTGLVNRDELIETLGTALGQQHQDESVAVLFVDIDRFKEVNDGISHTAGDKVLRRVADVLSEQIARPERVGRIGGDEFAVVLDQIADQQEATTCAEQLRAAITNQDFWSDGQRVPVTVSIGVAISRLGQNAHDMLSDADAALYEAKRAGRNRCVLADDSIRAAVTARIGLSGRIRSGIDQGQFHAWYQPIVDLSDRRILGYEALARWMTPDGVVAASEFIAAAEDSGMINELGRQVLTESIARIPFLPQSAIMSVNASASQLKSDGFAGYVLDRLHESNANPRQLVVEITEHSLLNLDDSARAGLTSLTDVGVGIYVDDFGTGYSSLATLLDYPVTGLKLDRVFAQRLAADESGPTSRLVAGLIDLTNRLELRGIAEGIETAHQESLLRKLGWHCGQGWLFGDAEPPRDQSSVPAMRVPTDVDISDGARGAMSRARD